MRSTKKNKIGHGSARGWSQTRRRSETGVVLGVVGGYAEVTIQGFPGRARTTSRGPASIFRRGLCRDVCVPTHEVGKLAESRFCFRQLAFHLRGLADAHGYETRSDFSVSQQRPERGGRVGMEVGYKLVTSRSRRGHVIALRNVYVGIPRQGRHKAEAWELWRTTVFRTHWG